MNAQHTPGPWFDAGTPIGQERHIVSDGPIAVAVLPMGGEADKRGQVEANSRLIAAAPDLLAALQLLADFSTDDSAGHMQYLGSIARAAIAKAM